MPKKPQAPGEGKRFQRRQENFICGHCAQSVRGNGFTNHCPQCLFSKHVDVFPGDRAAICQGPMAPVAVEAKGEVWRIRHRCERCGYEKINKRNQDDNFDVLIALSRAREW